jgi:hypothetical protein
VVHSVESKRVAWISHNKLLPDVRKEIEQMTNEEAIKMLERNRNANPNKPKFVEACNMAITALKENRPLKNRCRALSQSTLCGFCQMKCPDMGDEE